MEAILAALDADGSAWASANRKDDPRQIADQPQDQPSARCARARRLEFDDCMRMEFRMVNRVIAGHDFYEGVRATIIDKDRAPQMAARLAGRGERSRHRRLFRAARRTKELRIAMTSIAFIGVGNMGGPMARNLVKAGACR